MFNPEVLRPVLSRRDLIRFATVGGVSIAVAAVLPRPTEAKEIRRAAPAVMRNQPRMIELPVVPWQPPEYFPLRAETAQNLGMHTIYEANGPLAVYDVDSPLVGEATNFRQKGEDLADWYFAKYPKLPAALRDSTGFCHGIANASAHGEAEPVAEEQYPYHVKLGLLATLYSGAALYKPGIEQLMAGLVLNGRPFTIETQSSEGYWTRIVYGVDEEGNWLKATNFGGDPVVIAINDATIKNVYYPVLPGEEDQYPQGTVFPAINNPEILEKWTFYLDRRLVSYINYATPIE